MNMILFCFIIFIILVYSLWIGWKTNLSLKNNQDFYLGGRSLRVFPLCLSLLATQVGGGALIGSTEIAYHQGLLAFSYPLGITCGLFVLSLGIGERLRSQEIRTIPELFSYKLHSRLLQKICGLVSLLTLFLILIATAVATRKFCLSIGLESPFAMVSLWTAFVLYTSTGGLKAVVETDKVQMIYLLLVCFLVMISLFANLPQEDFLHLKEAFSFKDSKQVFNKSFFFAFCFTLIGQDMGQRCLAIDDRKKIALATRTASLLMMVIALIPFVIGTLSSHMQLQQNKEKCLVLEAISLFLGPHYVTLFAAAIMIAIISTGDSLLCSISSHIAYDIREQKGTDKKRFLLTNQVMTASIGFLALALSYRVNEIIPLMVIAYEIFVTLFFVPFMITILLPHVKRKAIWCCITIEVFCLFINFTTQKIVFSPIQILVLSFLSYFFGEILIKAVKIISLRRGISKIKVFQHTSKSRWSRK